MKQAIYSALFFVAPVALCLALVLSQLAAAPNVCADVQAVSGVMQVEIVSRPFAVKHPAEPETYLKPLEAELKKTWPKNRTINVVVHGHSVPAGYFKTPRVDTFNSYPHLVHAALNEQYPTAVINMITTAIGGEASPAGSKRFERDVLPHRPDLLLIDYGLNDRGQGLERSEAAWREMIETALENEVLVILLTPTAALRAKMDDPQDPINKHAELIRSLAKEYGVGLADSTAAFKQAAADGVSYRELMSQPVHPNRKGHGIVAAEVLKWFPQ